MHLSLHGQGKAECGWFETREHGCPFRAGADEANKSATSGRTPGLSPAQNAFASPHYVQPKNGRGAGQSPAMPVAPGLLTDCDVAAMAGFFRLLDAWDRAGAEGGESCRLCLITCNSSTGYFEQGPE